MNYTQMFGYLIAAIHATGALLLIIVPFLTSNIVILILIFIIHLVILLLWGIFNNKCIISIFEASLFDNTINDTVKGGHMNLFIHKLTYIFGEPLIKTIQAYQPYCMMCICALKIILASI